jgi:hypothetical protein
MKVTLRELFLLTVIVALSLGWWIDHNQQARHALQLFQLMRAVDRAGYSVYDDGKGLVLERYSVSED